MHRRKWYTSCIARAVGLSKRVGAATRTHTSACASQGAIVFDGRYWSVTGFTWHTLICLRRNVLLGFVRYKRFLLLNMFEMDAQGGDAQSSCVNWGWVFGYCSSLYLWCLPACLSFALKPRWISVLEAHIDGQLQT